MEILLKKDVANLGYAGEIVKVKAGYAMNYLVPQGFATVATESVKKQHAETLRQRAHKEAKLVADAEALAATINAQVLEVSAKVGETGKLYGSITTEQLAEALAAKGLNIEKKDITILADEVKELGSYEAVVKLYKGIKGTFKFNVVAE
ncbi:MAG: 50S ribosomal protein L9 [Bacteroidales bacterium]|nr:50S ribosomal protein L9 [Bacteroidales bacterium]